MNEEGFNTDHLLRIGVKGGGCSGMTYVLGFDKKTEKDRKILDRCEITTELEGFIPELYSRVDVVREDYYNSQPVSFLPITRFEKNYPIKNLKLKEHDQVQNEQKYDVAFFNEDLPFRDAAPYTQLRVCVLYKDGTKSPIVIISPSIYEKYFNNINITFQLQ